MIKPLSFVTLTISSKPKLKSFTNSKTPQQIDTSNTLFLKGIHFLKSA